ncbi:MAG: hypothetical protein MPJ50_15185 [Pirellulales bacterium]|nr:hypothetical protein [Pirellulales bacterium]
MKKRRYTEEQIAFRLSRRLTMALSPREFTQRSKRFSLWWRVFGLSVRAFLGTRYFTSKAFKTASR